MYINPKVEHVRREVSYMTTLVAQFRTWEGALEDMMGV